MLLFSLWNVLRNGYDWTLIYLVIGHFAYQRGYSVCAWYWIFFTSFMVYDSLRHIKQTCSILQFMYIGSPAIEFTFLLVQLDEKCMFIDTTCIMIQQDWSLREHRGRGRKNPVGDLSIEAQPKAPSTCLLAQTDRAANGRNLSVSVIGSVWTEFFGP